MDNIKEDSYDIELKNKYFFISNFKCFFFPSIVIFPLMLLFPNFKNNFYIFLSSFMSLFIFIWIIPYLSKISYTKPIYFEDLDDNNNDNSVVRNKILYNIELSKKFKDRFIFYQQLLTGITFGIVIEYLYYRYNSEEYKTIELLGLIGGILSLLAKIIRLSGKMMLFVLYRLKKQEKENLLSELNLNN
uniref:Uncharacterized protein n=1 Tax=Megaviridae environmental sample TaxID=1737588 RepID=A0A5J6VK47_9VIRU|nr:MAG: hypothetical protein [Megaviridae environmental sample]